MSQNIDLMYKDSNHYGDNHFTNVSALEQAVIEIKKSLGEDKEAVDIIDELADYITEHPAREVIELENKLKNGGREDLRERAVIGSCHACLRCLQFNEFFSLALQLSNL